MKLIALELTFIGKRMKSGFDSYLDGLKGIGPKLRTAFKEFKSVKRIKESSMEDFMVLFGEKKVKEYSI